MGMLLQRLRRLSRECVGLAHTKDRGVELLQGHPNVSRRGHDACVAAHSVVRLDGRLHLRLRLHPTGQEHVLAECGVGESTKREKHLVGIIDLHPHATNAEAGAICGIRVRWVEVPRRGLLLSRSACARAIRRLRRELRERVE